MITVPSPARADGPVRIVADLTPGPPDGVELSGWPAGATVMVTVDVPGVDPLSTVVDGLGNGGVSFPDGTVHVGTLVTATDGVTTKDLTMVEVRQEYLDAETDTVAGIAPPGAPVTVVIEVQAGEPWLSVPTTAGPDGRWSVALAPFDLQNGVNTHVDAVDGDGDATRFGAWVRRPIVSVNLDNPGITVDGFVAGTRVDVAVDLPPVGSPDETGSLIVERWGGASFMRSTTSLPAGTVVTASGGGWVKRFTVIELRPEHLDAGGDYIAGVAPEGTDVQVAVWPQDIGAPPPLFEGHAVAGSTNSWVVALAPFDLRDGQWVQAQVVDGEGDLSSYWTRVQRPFIFASITYADTEAGGPPDCFWLNGWTPGTGVHAEVHFLGDATVDWSTDVVFDQSTSGFCLGTSGRLSTASVVTASGGGWTKVLQLAGVRGEYVDADHDVVAGVAPAGAEVRVDINPAEGGPAVASGLVTAGADGWWRYDFGAVGADVPGGGMPPNQRVVTATVTDLDGDQTGHGANVQRPVVNATVGAGPGGYLYLTGWSDGTPITVAIDYDGDGTADESSPMIGHQFGPGVVIPDGHGPLQPGSVVTTTADNGIAPDRWQKVLVIEPLTVEAVDVGADTVAGTAPAGRTVTVEVVRDVPGPAPSVAALVQPDGTWTADFAGTFDILAGMSAAVRLPDGDGDTSGAMFGGAPAGPALGVTPSSELIDGQVVHLNGEGWPTGVGYSLAVSQCRTDMGLTPDACDPTTTVQYPVAPDGTVEGDYVVRRLITTGSGGVDCSSTPCGLVGVVWGSVAPGTGMPEALDMPGNNPVTFRSLLAVDDTADAREGMGPVSVAVLANDIGSPAMTVVDHGDPSNGGTVTCTDSACEYTAPLDGLAGTDTFTYSISDGASISSATVNVTVMPNASVVEGDRRTTDLVFTVRLLDRPSPRLPSAVLWCTGAGTAQPRADYAPTCGVISFRRGVATQTFVVTVLGDRRAEMDEHVHVQLVGINAVVYDAVLTGVILDDD
jgi:hypothetical protein